MFSAVADKLKDIFQDIIMWIFDSLVSPFLTFPTLKNLVFGRTSDEINVYGTFKGDELSNILGPLYYTMLTLSGFIFVGFIIFSGMRIASSPLNPVRRNETIEFLKDIFFVGIILVNLPFIYDLLFTLNMSLVNMFSNAFDNEALDLMSKLGSDSLEEMMPEDTGIGGFIGGIFIQLVLLGLMIWANFYYMMRKVTLIILMSLGTFAITCWLNPRYKSITVAWFKELNGTIFVQAIHAFVYWTIAMIAAETTNTVMAVIAYVIFIPISEATRRLFSMGGDMQNGLSRAGAMLGMAGLAGMYGSVKGAFNGGDVMSAVKGAYNGTKNKVQGQGSSSGDSTDRATDNLTATVGENPGSEDGTTSRADRMLKVGDVVGRGGKAVFGMAGAVAGAPLGPVGSMIGSSAGFATGGAIAGVAGRVTTAGVQGLANAINGEKEKLGDKGDYEESLANETADRSMASWADANKDSVMKDLKERFPDATDSELESKFNDIKADKRADFYNAAKKDFDAAKGYAADGKAQSSTAIEAAAQEKANQWGDENEQSFMDNYEKENPQREGESNQDYQSRKQAAFNNKKQEIYEAAKRDLEASSGHGGRAKGSSLVDASANAMANQWANDNKQSFMDAFEKENPQREGESNQDYEARKQNAFNEKKKSVLKGFKDAGNAFVSANAADENEPISKSDFIQHMNQAAEGFGVNSESMRQANESAVNHVTGAQLFDKNGKPNVQYLAGAMANAKTQRMGEAFIQDEMAKGVSREDASHDWVTNHAPKVHADNIQSYSDIIEETSKNSERPAFGKNTINQAKQIVGAASAGYTASKISGFGTISSIKGGINGATNEFVGQQIERHGGAVEAQTKFKNIAGYAAGMAFGPNAHAKAKSFASRHSPFNNRVESEINSPGEVIQMARTTTDDFGNTKIAPGAIRQVTTSEESYIEVLTKSGERKVVSKKGSGHSGLQKGDAVYRDLEADGEMLVPTSTSAYRIDSAGGRAKSSIEINNSPTSLLANPRLEGRHKAGPRKEAPVYSQFVDSGQFYTSDLANGGFSNPQVVVSKGAQYVTAEKDGVTYRVSKTFAGDSRLQDDQTVNIPVQIKGNTIEPSYVEGSNVAVKAIAPNSEGTNEVNFIPYYSSKGTKGLIEDLDVFIPSKYQERAERSLNRRKEIDSIRRKQGVLG